MLVSVRLQVSKCAFSIDIAQTNTHAYIMYAHKERNKKNHSIQESFIRFTELLCQITYNKYLMLKGLQSLGCAHCALIIIYLSST